VADQVIDGRVQLATGVHLVADAAARAGRQHAKALIFQGCGRLEPTEIAPRTVKAACLADHGLPFGLQISREKRIVIVSPHARWQRLDLPMRVILCLSGQALLWHIADAQPTIEKDRGVFVRVCDGIFGEPHKVPRGIRRKVTQVLRVAGIQMHLLHVTDAVVADAARLHLHDDIKEKAINRVHTA